LNFHPDPVRDRSDDTILIGWKIVPQTGHIAPFICAAFDALSANVCVFAILLPFPVSMISSMNYTRLESLRTKPRAPCN
jgi:hypothetical protein